MDSQDFNVLHSYYPYHNIKPSANFPSTLIMTADHDDRVVPLQSYKFTARLQEAQIGTAPILLRLTRKEGHGSDGGSIGKRLDNYADILSFLHKELNMEDLL